jgi:hypothetical protein
MTDNCSICLSPLKTDIFELSCKHRIHTKCYKMLINNNDCFFISCPLCRDMNINKPDLSLLSDKDKLWFFCKKQRCKAKNSKGLRCKNNCHPLNYGYCQHHHREIIPKSYYNLMAEYLQYLYTLDINHYSKLVLTDWSKKMMISNQFKENNIIEIMEKYNMFISYFKKKEYFESNVIPFNYIYTFYGIKRPPKKWHELCYSEKTII